MNCVQTHIGGSTMVFLIHGYDSYIDARNDVRHPNNVHLEYVRDGYVRRRETVWRNLASQKIIEWVKEALL